MLKVNEKNKKLKLGTPFAMLLVISLKNKKG